MRKRIAAALAAGLLLSGCAAPAGGGETGSPPPDTDPSPAVTDGWEQETVGSFEPESGVMTGGARAKDTYVTGLHRDGDRCDVAVTVAEDGFYDLRFTLRSEDGSYKNNYALLDGERLGELSCEGKSFRPCDIRRVWLTAGEHTVGLEKYWGYTDWEKLTLLTSRPFDESVFDVSAKLSDPDATPEARRLMSYLCDCYGKYILSGQYCDSGMNGWENLKISENNGGKWPAILGVDMAYYSQTGVDHGASVSSTKQAVTCHEQGGIVTICWHWLAPEKYITGTWYAAFRPEEVRMDLTAIMDGRDPEGLELLKKDIGNIARELQVMQEAGVPVLWRPLHEASGGWFWWGAHGAETYKKLYTLLYDTLTHEYGLHNLIWVWNGQDPDWYPGDGYVDIVGLDIYAGEHSYSSQIDAFLQILDWTGGKKPVVLSENGTMIDPDRAVRDRAMWGFFCTWSGEFVMNDGLRKTYSEQYTEIEMLKKVYQSDVVITRDELPDFSTYPIREEAG